MAGYKATVRLKCWKQHTCVGCGCVFRYVMERAGTGRAANPDGASSAAQDAALSTLTKEVDPHPCPQCGLYQPDMVGRRRGGGHRRLTVAALLGLPAAYVFSTAALDRVSFWPWLGAGLCAALLVLHIVAAARNPNADLAANRARAERETTSGMLAVDRPGTEAVPRVVPGSEGLGAAHRVAIAAMALATVAVATPEIARTGGGWPLNPGWDPPVAGPGDRARIDFPQRIHSVKGHWSGVASVHVVNGSDLGVQDSQFGAATRQDSWGNTISVKPSEKANASTIWTEVAVPDLPKLAGKTLELELAVKARYPSASVTTFQNTESSFQHGAPLRLAPRRAGSLYATLLTAGGVGGGLVFLFAAFGLGRLADRMTREARPTQLFALE